MNSDEINNIKAVLKSLVISSPNGITVERLQRDYSEEEGSKVPYEKFGFPTFEAFLKSIPDAVVVYGSGAAAIVDSVKSNKSMHIQNMVENQKKNTHPHTNYKKSFNDRHSRYKRSRKNNGYTNRFPNKSSSNSPSNNASQTSEVDYTGNTSEKSENNEKFVCEINKLKLSTIINTESRLTIFITEIHSPSMFWFHIHRNSHFLDILTQKMREFYAPLAWNDLLFPFENIKKGVKCAAYYNGHWNRVEILNLKTVLDANEVVVRLIDFGTVIAVSCYVLKYLLAEFARFPEQALCGKLSHIEPVNTKWTLEAVNAFTNMVNEKLVYALVTAIDSKREQAHLIICYKDDEEIIQVNSALIDDSHATTTAAFDTKSIQ